MSPHQLTLSEFKAAVNTFFDKNSEIRKTLVTLDLGLSEQSPLDKPAIQCITEILQVVYQNTEYRSDEEKRVIRLLKFLQRYA